MELSVCLVNYINNSDPNAFHTLVEKGDLAVECIRECFKSKIANREYVWLLDVLQNVRTPASRGLLRAQLLRPFSRNWVAAVDAFTYSWAPDLSELERFKSELNANDPETRSKAEVIELIFRDLA